MGSISLVRNEQGSSRARDSRLSTGDDDRSPVKAGLSSIFDWLTGNRMYLAKRPSRAASDLPKGTKGSMVAATMAVKAVFIDYQRL
jgi:hypothetical protein